MNKLYSFLNKNPWFYWIIGFQAFRFLLLPFMGLMPQDAYYYLYGQNLSFSYFDHPGMIGYQLRVFTDIFGKSIFVLKLSDFSITSLTIYSFYKLSCYFLPKEKQTYALVLLTSTLFISILSINSTPDVPLLLFWTLSILFLYKAIFLQKKWYWIWAGIAMGLSFNSKYTALLLQIGLLCFLLFSKSYRKLLLSPLLWLSLLISVIVMFPVWWWNYQNDFASFAFQGTNRSDSISKLNFNTGFFVGGFLLQAFLVIPVVFGILLTFTFKYGKRVVLKFKFPPSKTLFLLAFFIPTFVGFLALTPIYWVKMNWLMPAYITGIIIASMFISKKLLKWQLGISVVLHLLLAIQIVFYAFPIKSDDTWVGWKELANEIKKIQTQHKNTFVFSDDKYKTSACLNFYFKERVFAQNIINKHALHFDYLNDDLSLLKGKNAIFIDSDTRFKSTLKKGTINNEIKSFFSEIEELNPIIVNKGTNKERKFWVFLCKNYMPKK